MNNVLFENWHYIMMHFCFHYVECSDFQMLCMQVHAKCINFTFERMCNFQVANRLLKCVICGRFTVLTGVLMIPFV